MLRYVAPVLTIQFRKTIPWNEFDGLERCTAILHGIKHWNG